MTAKTGDSPTSAKQVAANRANALRSTGPQTVAGKAIVARNAVAHGLCAETPVLPGEDEAKYKLFRGHVLDDLAPHGMLECSMVERIAVLHVNGGAKRDHLGGVRRDRLAAAGLSP